MSKKEEIKKEEIQNVVKTGEISKFRKIMTSTAAKVTGGVVVLIAVVAAGYFLVSGDGGIEVPAE